MSELGHWGGVKDETGDGMICGCFEQSRKEKSAEIAGMMVGNNHPVCSKVGRTGRIL